MVARQVFFLRYVHGSGQNHKDGERFRYKKGREVTTSKVCDRYKHYCSRRIALSFACQCARISLGSEPKNAPAAWRPALPGCLGACACSLQLAACTLHLRCRLF